MFYIIRLYVLISAIIEFSVKWFCWLRINLKHAECSGTVIWSCDAHLQKGRFDEKKTSPAVFLSAVSFLSYVYEF